MKEQTDSYSALKDRIKALKENRDRHEALILNDLSKIYAITQTPAPYIKQVVGELAKDQDFRANLLKIALNSGTSYLYKILSHNESEPSLITLLAEKIGFKDLSKTGGFLRLLSKLLSKLSPEK